MDFGIPLEFPQRSHASSRVETCKSVLLLRGKRCVRLLVRLTYGSASFSCGATGLSHLPSCFQSFLGETFESAKGIFASGFQPVDWSLVQLGQCPHPSHPTTPPHHPSFKYSPCTSQMPEHRLVTKKFMLYPSSFCSSCPPSRLSPQKPSPSASGLTTLSAEL